MAPAKSENPKKKKTKCPSKACVCAILCMWQFVTLVAIIVCGVLFLKPYIRISRYQRSTCRVENSFYTNQYLCTCGWRCESLYPCLVIHVSINTTRELHTMALYTDDLHQTNVNEEKYDKGQACSIQVCHKDEMRNRAKVDAFHDAYGVRGTEFPCFYDPGSAEWGVVIRVVFNGMHVLHAMAWPSCAFVAGSLICAIFCQRCRTYTRPEKTAQTDETVEKVQLEPLTGANTKASTENEKADTNGAKKKKPSKKGKRDKNTKSKDKIETDSEAAESKPWL